MQCRNGVRDLMTRKSTDLHDKKVGVREGGDGDSRAWGVPTGPCVCGWIRVGGRWTIGPSGMQLGASSIMRTYNRHQLQLEHTSMLFLLNFIGN